MLNKEKNKAKNKEIRRFTVSVYFLLSIFFSLQSYSQCAMCRASLESSGDTGQAQAVNDGIVYLMVIPYILVALIGFAIYKMFQKKKNSSH
ncbi:hypothetical protein [Flavobacterium humi]|uniref:Uncharacterized protein n=1 Tax=Flavobacterium humi TaxID=2562683 RepID=A0A4Z0L760_9FLAO|nr:hypothetical protein [Flavobacterium humi]TGD58353.1 hypothetical protein E4635_05425 [Flavobacterium humi]